LGNNDTGVLQEIRPAWDGGNLFDMRAIPKSACAQYGSVVVPGAQVQVAMGYRRYRDCDKGDSPGQDYAVIRGDGRHVVGVLADGVGQSFFGNLAAEKVSNWLLEELWRSRWNPSTDEDLEQGLRSAEKDFSLTIENYSLDHLPDWHQKALEGTRRAGSQAVFATFVWDFREGSGYLYQVGDVVAILFRNEGPQRIESNPKGRWSSAGRSQLHLLRTDLSDATAILLKSDGADPAWGLDLQRQIWDRQGFLEMASRRAEGDDVSFVAGCLRADVLDSRGEFWQDVEAPTSASTYIPGLTRSDSYGYEPRTFGRGFAQARTAGTPSMSDTVTRQEARATPGSPVSPARLRFNRRVLGLASLFVLGLTIGLGFLLLVKRPPRRQNGAATVAKSTVASDSSKHGVGRGGGKPSTVVPTPSVPLAQSQTVQAKQVALSNEEIACNSQSDLVKPFLTSQPQGIVLRVRSNVAGVSGFRVEGDEELDQIRSVVGSDGTSWYLFVQPQSGQRGLRLHVFFKQNGAGSAALDHVIEIRAPKSCNAFNILPGTGGTPSGKGGN
jgi:Protein phosphatase 2C